MRFRRRFTPMPSTPFQADAAAFSLFFFFAAERCRCQAMREALFYAFVALQLPMLMPPLLIFRHYYYFHSFFVAEISHWHCSHYIG